MKKNLILLSIMVLAAALSMSSCAVESTETDSSYFDRELRAWVLTNYPQAIDRKLDNGSYILDFLEGSGTRSVADTSYVAVKYTKTELHGEYISTTSQTIDEILGNFSYRNYYGPVIWKMGNGYVTPDIEQALKRLKEGGEIKVALPVSASGVTTKTYDAFPEREIENVIYDMTLVEIIPNVFEKQKEELKEHSRRYADYDTSAYDFYFKKLKTAQVKEGEETIDSLSSGNTINVRYVGRLLSGQVFDTNIKDTAKKYRIYDPDNEYSALEAEYYKSLDDMKTKNSLVDGFLEALIKMQRGEEAIVFFNSNKGYKANGSSPSIPPYAPLEFQIWVEEK